jgi:transcription elongation factor GreA
MGMLALFDTHRSMWKQRRNEDVMADKKILTQEGYNALQEELENLKLNRRKEVADKIKEARAQGDLSENAEYDAAKDEQREIEGRIDEINNIMKNAEVISDEDVDENVISIGCTVKLRDIELKEDLEFKLVGSTESDILHGKLSNESPVGHAVIGAKVGKTVKVDTPSGDTIKYKVIEFHR